MNERDFVERWRRSQASERSNYVLYLTQLCDVLGVDQPLPATSDLKQDGYIFERPVHFRDSASGTTGFIDFYRRGSFVLETKQGHDDSFTGRRGSGHGERGSKAWERSMQYARAQAARYAVNLGKEEPVPPFLVVVDVGFCFDLYADFTGQGRLYTPYPDAKSYRIRHEQLVDPDVRELLRLVWNDPAALDPSRRKARVTQELADKLARLARTFEGGGHSPDAVFGFLSRCLFTMFAEDVGLIPDASFTRLLEEYRDGGVEFLPDALAHLWTTMDKGGFSPTLRARIKQFNGGLFHESDALPLTTEQVDLLLEAAKSDWRKVEPAIFGTLLERALDPKERHKLGAHYTPRAYVERLVGPVVIEPLREEWEATQATVARLENEAEHLGTTPALKRGRDAAVQELKGFLKRLSEVRVLDPACGSGNFLYVTMDHLKHLEDEVRVALARYGEAMLEIDSATVTPAQMIGLELNPRAARIADLVLWIGYLQWHLEHYGDAIPLSEPILKAYGNIHNEDAVVTPEGTEPEWPRADYIIGNPPFVGTAKMRDSLGDEYTERVRRTYKGRVPESADFVMYWWEKGALEVRSRKAQRFGFITTNSITQTFLRRVVERHVNAEENPLSLLYAIPDHPWVDSVDGAAVRIAMTVGGMASGAGKQEGTLFVVDRETPTDQIAVRVDGHTLTGLINPDLTVGVDLGSSVLLRANSGISNRGLQLFGSGFIIDEEQAALYGYGQNRRLQNRIRPYVNGRDLTSTSRGVYVIDLFGLSESEARIQFPELYQKVLKDVKPERDKNRRDSYRINWWFFGEPRKVLRKALEGLPRYIATVETSKYRFFVYLDAEIAPDNKLIVIALDSGFHLGVLSSRIHGEWALGTGGQLGPTPVYVKSKSFEAFPFPDATPEQQKRIGDLAEEIDAFRKDRQAKHAHVTLTDLYNVIEKLRSGEALTKAEQRVCDDGLAVVLKELHDRLDAAVAEAYGWPWPMDTQEILGRLVALNAERAEEEKRGIIRWLRPDFQAAGQEGTQLGFGGDLPDEEKPEAPAALEPWPSTTREQVAAVRRVLRGVTGPVTAKILTQRFKGVKVDAVKDILDTLLELGLVQASGKDLYAS